MRNLSSILFGLGLFLVPAFASADPGRTAPPVDPTPNAFGCHWYEGDDLYTCIFTVLDGLCDGCISGCQGDECGEEEGKPAECVNFSIGHVQIDACHGDLGLAYRMEADDLSVITACGELGCRTAIDGRDGGDPTEGQACVGRYCVGCNTADDVGSDLPYLECFACAGDECISATCTANDGWHCCWGC